MPAIAGRNSTNSSTTANTITTAISFPNGPHQFKEVVPVGSVPTASTVNCTTRKRNQRSESSTAGANTDEGATLSPVKLKSPRRCYSVIPSGTDMLSTERHMISWNTPEKRLSDYFIDEPKWNPIDSEQMRVVKEALHVSTSPSTILCREEEQKKVLEFCKECIEQEKSGSLYVCGCPGTGKSLCMNKVKQLLLNWTEEAGHQRPDILSINCTSLTNTSDIFNKILGMNQPQKKVNGSISPLKQLQKLYSQKPSSSTVNMKLILADELDYLITKDRAILHDLFMLTTLPFSKFILIGIANAMNLADHFLPRLKSLNCKPAVVAFRAYSKDQILKILEERLRELPYAVFQHQALELCARKVAAASGDMRKGLGICRSAIDILEAEIRESMSEKLLSCEELAGQFADYSRKQSSDIVRIDHMVVALSKTFGSHLVDTIQSLPHHQQMILCSIVKCFRGGKKHATLGELNKSYLEICKSALMPAVGNLEFSNMCSVLNDQGILKVGQSREDKLRRVTLKADEADITFALQGTRFFQNFLKRSDC